MLARLVCLLVLTIATSATSADAQPRTVVLQFMAPEGNWGDRGFTGGAFVCVQVKSGTGLKEDCFGFYPRRTGKAVIGGPGVIDREHDFSKRTTYSLQQRKGIRNKTHYRASAREGPFLYQGFRQGLFAHADQLPVVCEWSRETGRP